MGRAKISEGNSGEPKKSSALTKHVDKRIANLKPFKPGQSGNPKGRRKGQRDYRTLFWIALERIANNHDMTPEEVEEALHVAGVTKAIKGDFFFWQEIANRVYGKPKEHMELTGKLSIADLIKTAHGKDQSGADAPGKV